MKLHCFTKLFENYIQNHYIFMPNYQRKIEYIAEIPKVNQTLYRAHYHVLIQTGMLL